MTMNNDDLHSISVLIVDGDAEARAETQAMLARFGVGSDSYGSLAKAMDMIRLHHARRQDYDLILADRVLAENDGNELIREARTLLGENATVIIMTASGSNEVETEAKKAGAAVIAYGSFINTVIDFLLIALAVFIVIKQINRLRKPAEEPAPARTCPYCKSEIADDATRCPHCTSQLD